MTALWRPPSLRGAEHASAGSAVSWTELFYDLVFVVAIANLGHRFVSDVSIHGAVEFVALFGMLWWAWASVTFLVDRYESNDAIDRLLAVVQMFALAGFAAAVAGAGDLDAIAVPIAATYAQTRLVLLAMYARVWWHLRDSRPLVGGYLIGFGVDTVLWLVSTVTPGSTRYALWLVAMLISVATPWLMRRAQVRSPLSTSHLPERFGLFTILVLGESVAAVVAGLHIGDMSMAAFAGAAAGLVVATGLWWIYFDNFEGSVVRRDPNRRHDWRPTAWIYVHFPLVVCLTALGGGMAHLMTGAEHGTRALAITCGVALAGALVAMAVILVSTAGEGVASRRRRALARVAGALLVIGLTVASEHRAPHEFLIALGGVLVLQVLFDVGDHTLPADHTPAA